MVPEAFPVTRDESLQAIVFVLGSGAEVAAAEIALWPKDLLDEASALLAQSDSRQQGFSTGLGFIGPLGWVVTRSLVLGAIEGTISHGMRESAVGISGKAASCVERAAREKWMAPVKHIANVESPTPEAWVAAYRWPSGIQRAFIHSGEPFLLIKTMDGALRNVIWASVEQVYSIRAAAPPALVNPK